MCLIAEREHERLRFHKSKYWTLTAANEKDGTKFESRSFLLKGKRVATGKDFDPQTGKLLEDKKAGTVWLTDKEANEWLRPSRKNLGPSTKSKKNRFHASRRLRSSHRLCNRSSNRKLGLSSRENDGDGAKTVRTRFHHLYAYGFTNLSTQAIAAARETIEKMYGKKYLPDTPREYTGKKSQRRTRSARSHSPGGYVVSGSGRDRTERRAP